MYKESFINRLIKARKDAGYTQIQVAEFLEIPRSTLANYETGRTEPDLETLSRIIEFYDIDANWLLETGMKRK